MRTFAVECWDDEGREVTYYTVRKDGAKATETDKFFTKFEHDDRYSEDLDQLAVFILNAMGEHKGALEIYFRFENSAVALPPSPSSVRNLGFDFHEFPLRLYCLRLSNHCVILMNGGVKTDRSAQGSKDISLKLVEANAFARAIERALKEGYLWLDSDERTLCCDEEEIILDF